MSRRQKFSSAVVHKNRHSPFISPCPILTSLAFPIPWLLHVHKSPSRDSQIGKIARRLYRCLCYHTILHLIHHIVYIIQYTPIKPLHAPFIHQALPYIYIYNLHSRNTKHHTLRSPNTPPPIAHRLAHSTYLQRAMQSYISASKHAMFWEEREMMTYFIFIHVFLCILLCCEYQTNEGKKIETWWRAPIATLQYTTTSTYTYIHIYIHIYIANTPALLQANQPKKKKRKEAV